MRIDELTAGLLDPRFEVEGDGPVRLLVRAAAEATDTRRLLGRVTPCVGRDKELGLLAATFEECLAEPVARAVLVTAPAGGGKSRLQRELMKRTNDPTRRFLVNFQRGLLFGKGTGHHSPIAGWLEAEDLVFVLDVNEKFGPWLVPTERLFEAVDSIDTNTDKKRGLLEIE